MPLCLSYFFRQALQEALDENQKLLKIIEDLKEENKATKQMLEEANSFIEVVKVLFLCNNSCLF